MPVHWLGSLLISGKDNCQSDLKVVVSHCVWNANCLKHCGSTHFVFIHAHIIRECIHWNTHYLLVTNWVHVKVHQPPCHVYKISATEAFVVQLEDSFAIWHAFITMSCINECDCSNCVGGIHWDWLHFTAEVSSRHIRISNWNNL